MAVIALTGGTGFVGAHLINNALDHGHTVKALTRRPQPARPGLEWVPGTLEDGAALERLVAGSDAVVHLAAVLKALDRRHFFAANVDGTCRLIDAMGKTAPGAKLVHVSSLAARWPEFSHYAASKYEAEKAVESLGASQDWMIVRPPGVYGPGDREILKLIKAARRGILPVPGNRHHRVSLIYGPDLAEVLGHLTQSHTMRGQLVDVDDGHKNGYSYEDLAQVLSGGLGRPVRIMPIPAPVLMLAGHISNLWGKAVQNPSMLTAMKARELLHPDWVSQPSGEGLEQVWTPQHNFATGLAKTLDWARKEKLF